MIDSIHPSNFDYINVASEGIHDMLFDAGYLNEDEDVE